jgi:hypothetical protein
MFDRITRPGPRLEARPCGLVVMKQYEYEQN